MVVQKNKGGRPRKIPDLDEEQLAQVEVMGAFLTVEQMADYFGISRTAFFGVMERQPEVSERYKKGQAKAIGAVAQNLIMQAREGNLTAAIFYLKTKAGWKETQVVDNTSSDGSLKPVLIELVAPDLQDENAESAD